MATHVRHMMHIMVYIQCYLGLRRHKANAAQQSIAHGLLTVADVEEQTAT